MASLLIRKLDDTLKERLRVRAAVHGRSVEAEARAILRQSLGEEKRPVDIVSLAQELFGKENGVELEPHPPVLVREPPDFSQ